MRQVKIIAEVTIEIEDSTNIDDIVVDIFTHNGSKHPRHEQRVDQGADEWEIIEYESEAE